MTTEDQTYGARIGTPGNFNNDPSMHSEMLDGQRVSFISGWQHKDGNRVFAAYSDDQLRYSARLEHAVYLVPDLSEAEVNDFPVDTAVFLRQAVVDFDGHVDVVRIADYPGIHALGAAGAGFSFEFWIRLRRMPRPALPYGLISKWNVQAQSGYSLLVDSQGTLTFVATVGGTTQTFSSAPRALREGRFTHLSVSGVIGSTMAFGVDGTLVSAVTAVEGQTIDVLPATDGELTLGNAPGAARLNGQMTSFFLYNTQRTQADIAAGRLVRERSNAGLAGGWPLTLRARLNLTCYFITPDYLPEGAAAPTHQTLPADSQTLPADVPATPVVILGNRLCLFRQTTDQRIFANVYHLAGGSLVQEGAAQRLPLQHDCYRGWFTAAYNRDTDLVTLFNCGARSGTSVAGSPDVIDWKTFRIAADGTVSENTGTGFSGTLTPKNSDGTGLSFSSHPTAVFRGGHLILAIATTDLARTLVLDFTVASNGSLNAAGGEIVVGVLGHNDLQSGVTRYGHVCQRLPGQSPRESTLIASPQDDVRYGSHGVLVRMRTSMAEAKVPSEYLPTRCLSAADWDRQGADIVADPHVSLKEMTLADAPQCALWRLVNLTSPGKPLQSGDAITIEAFTTRGFIRMSWFAIDDQNYRWSATTIVEARVDSLNQVFGIEGLDAHQGDEYSQISRRAGEIFNPDQGNRVLIVPGVYQHAIDPSATALRADVLSPRGTPLPDGRIQASSLRFDTAGIAIVFLDPFITPIPISPSRAESSAAYLARARSNSDSPNDPPFLRFNTVCDANLGAVTVSVVDNATPLNDWYWYSFRMTTFYGGATLASGQEILLESPDINNDNAGHWCPIVPGNSYVVPSRPVMAGATWNFWIFKVGTWTDTLKTIQRGPIYPSDPVILWPRTPEWEASFGNSGFPSPNQLKAAAGNYITPVVFVEPAVERPFPAVASVLAANQPAQFSFTAPALQSGLAGAVLGFATTLAVPAIRAEGAGNDVQLIFRGNGAPLTLANGLVHPLDSVSEVNTDFYREGSYNQSHMTAGLFYEVTYQPRTDGTGSWSNLRRFSVERALEFPVPPPDFVWAVPPAFKVMGVCEGVATLGAQSSTTPARSFVHAVIEAVKGPGTFGEGIFKPVLSIPISEDAIGPIAASIQKSVTDSIFAAMPDPDVDDRAERDAAPRDQWSALADLVTANALSTTQAWTNKINLPLLHQKYQNVMNSEWMAQRLTVFRDAAPGHPLTDLAPRYAAYGGVSQLIASFLQSADFVSQLELMDSATFQRVVRTQLHTLGALDPTRAIAVGQALTVALLSKTILDRPGDILNTFNADELNEAFQQIVAGAVLQPDSEDAKPIILAMTILLGIGGSSPLGTTVSSIDGALTRTAVRLNPDVAPMIDNWVRKQQGSWSDLNRSALNELPRGAGDPSSCYGRVTRESWPTVKAGLTVLGTLAAVFAVKSFADNWKGTDEEKLTLAASIVGSTAGVLETGRLAYDFLAKARGSARVSPVSAAGGDRMAGAGAAAPAEALAEEASVFRKLSKFAEPLGPVADAIFFGYSIYQITQDEASTDVWKVSIDVANTTVAGAGLVAGLALMAELAFAGPLAGVVLLLAAGLMIADACHSKAEQEEAENKRRELQAKYDAWVAWGRVILVRHGLLLAGFDAGFLNGEAMESQAVPSIAISCRNVRD